MASWNPIHPYSLKTLLLAIIDPWIFLGLSVSHIPATIGRLLRSRDYTTLLSPSSFQSAWFGTFWATVGPRIREGNWDRILALLDGRVRHGTISDSQRVGVPASGTVIEVGAGSGMWVGLFAEPSLRGRGSENEDGSDSTPLLRQRKGEEQKGGVTKVYGVEPNPDMHPLLRESIANAGLDDGTYEIVPVGIESLASEGRVPRESVDCIVSILCLCSIPDPERNIRELYSYLKPGGRWYVMEHVRTFPEQGWAMGAYQAVVNVFWWLCLGGCELRRDTGRSLREAGPWSEVDLVFREKDDWCSVCPHIFGTLTK
jgi:SAM-dependent methyltransferase